MLQEDSMEENKQNRNAPPPLSGAKKQPIVLIAQLMQNMLHMQHIDEVFIWLAQAMVQHLEIPLVQCWALQADTSGQVHVQLRALAVQNLSLHSQLYVNDQVIMTMSRFFKERPGMMSVPVENIFLPQQASLFKHHRLPYWTGYLLRNSMLLAPARDEQAPDIISTPLNLIVSSFTQAPLSQDQARAVTFMVEQSIRVLLTQGARNPRLAASAPIINKKMDNSDTLAAIIPRLAHDMEQYQAANPFTSTTIIADKNARRLYAAIDGYKSGADLAQATRLTQQEVIQALDYLYQQQRIQLYTSKGEFVEHFPFE
ncbi:hypothetical protein ccbrp13_47390 [Ktedonobacteria bacterium brp13]|nr:hypothetical protein ccbrp13_47390 [Ktedonobacteria bacterium brp13]